MPLLLLTTTTTTTTTATSSTATTRSSPVTISSSNSANRGFFTLASGTTSYVHAGLDSRYTYYYAILSTNSAASSGLSNEVSARPSGFSGPPVCNTTGTLTDNDADLLVHYAFSNNLNDSAGSGTTGSPYNLSNLGGTIKYAQSCAYGQAAYFDSSTGEVMRLPDSEGKARRLYPMPLCQRVLCQARS